MLWFKGLGYFFQTVLSNFCAKQASKWIEAGIFFIAILTWPNQEGWDRHLSPLTLSAVFFWILNFENGDKAAKLVLWEILKKPLFYKNNVHCKSLSYNYVLFKLIVKLLWFFTKKLSKHWECRYFKNLKSKIDDGLMSQIIILVFVGEI